MTEDQPSTTALGATKIRAVHQLIDETPHILEDPVSLKLIGDEAVREIQDHPEEHGALPARGLRSHVVLRSRFAEDQLRQAVESGVTRFVNLGAGYDTFAARQPGWAHALRIIEVDRPASQAAKIEAFKTARIEFPQNVEFVPLDLDVADLRSALAKTARDLSRPTFVACLGVLAYLRLNTVRKVFQAIASALPRGTTMVVAFAPRGRGTEMQVDTSTADKAAAQGEPWFTRFDPMELRQE